MQNGGGWWNQYGGNIRGHMQRQVEAQIKDGVPHDVARRFVDAVGFGGLSEAESWALIRDRDCARWGRLHELINFDDLPDRWFRDAWHRSDNGGPVVVNLAKARRIQLARIKAATEAHNGQRFALGRRTVAPQWATLGTAIRNARDADELRRVWPEQLPHPMR